MLYHCEYFRHDECETKLDTSGRLLGQVKTGVEHLAEKLKHVKTVSIHLVSYSPVIISLSASFPYTQTSSRTRERGGSSGTVERLRTETSIPSGRVGFKRSGYHTEGNGG